MKKPSTIQSLQRLVGKVCTIIVPSINRNFSEEQARDHYVTIVTSVNEDGVFGYHPYQKTFNFYNINHIVSIHEEKVLDPNNPEDLKLIKQLEKESGQKVESDIKPLDQRVKTEIIESHDQVGNSPFVDITNLSKIAKLSKQQFNESL